MRVDAEGIAERVLAVPIAAGRFEQLMVLEDSRLLLLRMRPAGGDAAGDGAKGRRKDGRTAPHHQHTRQRRRATGAYVGPGRGEGGARSKAAGRAAPRGSAMGAMGGGGGGVGGVGGRRRRAAAWGRVGGRSWRGRRRDAAAAEEEGEEAEAGSMVRFDLGTSKEVPLLAGVVEFTLSADLRTVAVLCEEADVRSVRVYEAGAKPPMEDDDEVEVDEDVAGEASGLVDVEGRVTLTIDRQCERRQMFYEGWAAAVRHTHPSIVKQLDPAAILGAYERLLPLVHTHAELIDLMNEMVAELGASHASVSPPEMVEDDEGTQGLLGLGCNWDEEDEVRARGEAVRLTAVRSLF